MRVVQVEIQQAEVERVKKQPEIHSRVKYFKALMAEGVREKDRSKARKRRKRK